MPLKKLQLKPNGLRSFASQQEGLDEVVDVTAEQRGGPAADTVVGDEVEAGVQLLAQGVETELVVAADAGAGDGGRCPATDLRKVLYRKMI
mgnify:CR=1 FL=1